MSRTSVAVIGGGIAGLTSATVLARQGHDVTLFEAGHRVGGKAERIVADGVVLDTGPTLLTMPDVVRETFASIDASDLLPELMRLSLQCRYHWPDGRSVDAYEDVERTIATASGFEDAQGFRSLYSEAEEIYRGAGEPYLSEPFTSPLQFIRRVMARGVTRATANAVLGTMASFAARHFRSPELRQFVGRFATYAGASPFEASATFAMIPHIERALGVHHVKGGMGALSGALEKAARRNSVKIHTGVFASRSRGTDGKFFVGPVGGEETFDSVVVNADPLSGRAKRDGVSLSGYVLLVATGGEVTLPHHTIVFSRSERDEFDALFRGELPADLTLYVCHPAATDASMAPHGEHGLYLMLNAPAGYFEGPERLRELCLKKLRELIGAEADVRIIGERTPADFARLGAPLGSLYGYVPHGRLAALRRPSMVGRERGLFFCGGGTYPGGGVPLVMLSGRFAASLADRHLRGAA